MGYYGAYTTGGSYVTASTLGTSGFAHFYTPYGGTTLYSSQAAFYYTSPYFGDSFGSGGSASSPYGYTAYSAYSGDTAYSNSTAYTGYIIYGNATTYGSYS